MHRVSKTSAASRGTPSFKELSPIGDNLKNLVELMRCIIACLIIREKKPNHNKFVSTYLEWYAYCLILKCNEEEGFCQSMRVFVGYQILTEKMIIQKYGSLIKQLIASKPTEYELGVVIGNNFGNHIGNSYFHTDHPNWKSTFQYVWIQMFPPESELQTIQKIVATEKEIRMLKRDVEQLKFENSKRRNHFFQNAITVQVPFVPARHHRPLFDTGVISIHKPVVPAQVPEVQQEDDFLEIVEVPLDQESGNDAKELILAVVKSALEDCVAKAVALATANAGESVQPEEQSSDVFVPGDYEAGLLFLEMDGQSENQFHANGSGESLDSESRGIQSLDRSNEDLRNIFHAQIELEVNSLPTGFAESVNDAAGRIASILKEIKNLRSNSSSPLPHGEGRAQFTTSAQSPLQSVEDGASGAHPLSLADSLKSADAPQSSSSNPGINLSSGPSGTSLTRESSSLLAASIDPSHQSSFIPAAVTSADGSPQEQSSDNQSENVSYLPPPNLLASLVSPLPTQSSPLGDDIGVGGAQSSGKPPVSAPPPPPKTQSVIAKMNGEGAQSSGKPLGIVHSIVGGRRNPPADLIPPVQVLAQSGDPPGNSGGADQPETPSSIKLGSDSSQAGTDLSASLPPPNLFGTNGKPVHPLPLSPQSCPSGHDIGGSQGAHSSGDPPGFVPSSAPFSSSKLESAATPALSLPTCPSGHDIGGKKRSGEMLDFWMVYLRSARLRHIGVPLEQEHLFSHIPPAHLAQAVEVA